MNRSHTPPQEYFQQICHVRHAEDLFGPLGAGRDEQLENLEACFRELIKAYHPDQFAAVPETQLCATEITRLLIGLKQQARRRIQQGLYGQPAEACRRDYASVLRGGCKEIYITELWIEGQHADLYRGYIHNPPGAMEPYQDVVVKIIANPSDNPLMENELAVYEALAHFSLPEYLDSFRTPDRRQALVLGYIPGGYDLLELRQRYARQYGAAGLPQQHVAWILDRCLAVLGLLHSRRILHGDLQPDNLVVQPATHNVFLLDFLHSRINPASSDLLEPLNPDFCAPEVCSQRFKPHPVSDIYALGKCMLYLLGGEAPARIPGLHPELARFFLKMIHPDPLFRAADAWQLAAELSTLRQRCFGAAHQFIPLEIGGPDGRR